MQPWQQCRVGERRDIGVAQYSGVTRRCFLARATPVEKPDLEAAPLQFECAANADDAGAKHRDLLFHWIST